MRRNIFSYRVYLLTGAASVLVVIAACKESYTPLVVSTNNSYLVVEGFINNGPDTTRINLTHTFKLDDTATVVPELNAAVYVEGKAGDRYPLTESGGGLYIAPGLSLNGSEQYQLHITTGSGKNYASDFVDLKSSPPIDSINWIDNDQGLTIYANTHDPQSASRYYRWEFNETWEFHAYYYSAYEYVNHDIESRIPNTIYFCWKSNASTGILIGSSAKLAADEIYRFPLVRIEPNSWKVSVKYSILVRQYVLTQDAYNFWQQLQKNSEQIGSVFSPQPSEAKGNIHNLADSTEQVIGYISAGTLRMARIYITPEQIPGWYAGSYTNRCEEQSIPLDSLDIFLATQTRLPIDQTNGPGGQLRYLISTRYCADCTLTGTNVKPYFWP